MFSQLTIITGDLVKSTGTRGLPESEFNGVDRDAMVHRLILILTSEVLVISLKRPHGQ